MRQAGMSLMFWGPVAPIGVTKATSEEEALQRLLKHSADYAHRITVYKKDGKTIKREIAEYDQWEKRWLT